MSVFKIGPIIQARRRELGISQEDLADGICAVPTLSRIENGERLPTKNHFEALMERLGYSSVMLDSYIDENTLTIQELKSKIQQCYKSREIDAAREYLRQLELLVEDHTSMDWQITRYNQILLNPEKMTSAEKRGQLEETLLLSCPHYRTKGLPKFMSYLEINILNSIAITYGEEGEREKAITILQHLWNYYDHHVMVPEEALRTQPMVLYNLSKYLGLSERFDECIAVCDQGIRIARCTGRSHYLSRTLYNRAWALLRRGRETDREQAELSLRQACYQAYAMQYRECPAMIRYYEEEFGPLKL